MIPVLTPWMLLLACGGGAEAPAPKPVEVEPAPKEIDHAAAHLHMAEHFEAVTKARNAIIAGDMEAARQPLVWLGGHEAPKELLPEGWLPFVDAMQSAAGSASARQTQVEMAQDVARAAATCGQCHTHFKQGPKFDEVPPPSDAPDAKEHMKRHQWAADRMWEGLVSGDATRWAMGTEVMREAHLEKLEGGEADTVKALATRLHELGSMPLNTVASEQQALVYGDFIATCGTCHAATGKGPEE